MESYGETIKKLHMHDAWFSWGRWYRQPQITQPTHTPTQKGIRIRYGGNQQPEQY